MRFCPVNSDYFVNRGHCRAEGSSRTSREGISRGIIGSGGYNLPGMALRRERSSTY